ncbi:hypothetical protein MD484_g5706, partial [Candolleomyces efflorescens]
MDLKNARCVVVFDGDLDPGTPGIQPSRNLHTVGVSLLSECSRALSLEFASLDPDVKLRLRAVETVLQNPAWLLDSPSVIASYPQILSLPKLCFEQALRNMELMMDSRLPCSWHHGSSTHKKFLASSTGLLAAVPAATSINISQYLAHIPEAIRLAFWIAYRIMESIDPSYRFSSRKIEGISKEQLTTEIINFNKTTSSGDVCLAADLADSALIITGPSEDLQAFSSHLQHSHTCRIYEAIPLLHLSQQGDSSALSRKVLEDVNRRRISFPSPANLQASIFTCTMHPVISPLLSTSLLETVLEALFSVPLDYQTAVCPTVSSIQGPGPVHIVDVGPGTKLTCRLGHALTTRGVAVVTHSYAEVGVTSPSAGDRIAIVGLALRTPGASSPEELWSLIESGQSTLGKIPTSRFNSQDYLRKPRTRRTCTLETGNFLADLENFDNELFRISPREARAMDPQQRLLLHVAYEALEDAGYVPHSSFSSDPDHVGIFVGCCSSDYVHNSRDDIDIHYITGTLSTFLSGRISYTMGFGGPSLVVDTACSASGFAIHNAVRSLQNGDCRMALAGGVNVITCPDLYVGLDAARFLSRSGQARPFDAEADGYSRSEGCVLFVLKRFQDAVLDNDRILGVIRGVEVNQTHLNSSIIRTHSPTQTALLSRLLRSVKLQPEDVDVIEAHAAGTKQGDTTELLTIQNVFLKGEQPRRPLYVTSIKAFIGHSEAASGAGSLAKLLLMLHHETIPRQIAIRTLNPAAVGISALSIPTESTAWKQQGGKPRRAVVNNYGASGANASILVEEHLSPCGDDEPRGWAVSSKVFGMSAPNRQALEELKEKWVVWLNDPSNEASVSDICYSSTARRQQHEYRLSFATPNERQEFASRLLAAPIVKVESRQSKVVFVFAGHGSQNPGMGAVLYKDCAVFRIYIDICNDILVNAGFPNIMPYLLDGSKPLSDEASVIEHTALLSFEVALSMMWKSWGVLPSAVIGHSLGEYAALVVSGILGLQDALHLVGGRARLVQQKCTPGFGGMLSVQLPINTIERVIQSDARFTDLGIACSNSKDRQTVAGPLSQLAALQATLKVDHHVDGRMLPADFAYHSAAMDGILDEFRCMTDNAIFMSPMLPLASTATGTVIEVGCEGVSSYHLLQHCRGMVRFPEAVNALLDQIRAPDSDVCWVEVSPHRTLLPMIREMCSDSSHSDLYMDSLFRRGDPWKTLMDSLSRFYIANINVDWKRVFSCLGEHKLVALPSYPFQSRPFYIPYEDPSLLQRAIPREETSAKPSPSSFPISITQAPTAANKHQAIFSIDSSHAVALADAHVLASVPMCPASLYLEAILTGASMAHSHLSGSYPERVIMKNIEFVKPIVAAEGKSIAISLDVSQASHYDFIITSLDPQSRPIFSNLNARGQCQTLHDPRLQQHEPCIQQRIQELDPSFNDRVEVLSSKALYEVVFCRIVRYGSSLRSLRRLVIAETHQEAHATMQLSSPPSDPGTSIVHPAYLDAMIHLPGFIINLHAGPDDLFVCYGIGLVEVLPGFFTSTGSPIYRLYTTITSPAKDTMIAETVVLARDSWDVIATVKNIGFKKVPMRNFAARLLGPSIPAPTDFVNVNESSPCKPAPSHLAIDTPLDISKPSASLPFSLRATLEDVLHLPRGHVRGDSSLDSLGLDSITSIEILQILKSKHNVTLSPDFFQKYSVMGQVEAALPQRLSLPNHRERPSQRHPPVSPPPPLTETSATYRVRAILEDSLHLQRGTICSNSLLESLGLDSITSIEILHALKTKHGLTLAPNFFEQHATVGQVESALQLLSSPSPSSSLSSDNGGLLHLRSTSSSKPPICIFHDGSGLASSYRRLLDIGRDIWAFRNPRMSENFWDSLDQMACSYTNTLLSRLSGDIILAGWSFGGAVTYEVTKQLQSRQSSDITIQGIILIDAPLPPPAGRIMLSESLISHVIDEGVRQAPSLTPTATLKGRFKQHVKLFSRYRSSGPLHTLVPCVFVRGADAYSAPPTVEVSKWLTSRTDSNTTTAGWEGLVGEEIRVVDVPGHHFELFSAKIETTSKAIAEACTYIERQSSGSARAPSRVI